MIYYRLDHWDPISEYFAIDVLGLITIKMKEENAGDVYEEETRQTGTFYIDPVVSIHPVDTFMCFMGV